jgi:hypothetical protein
MVEAALHHLVGELLVVGKFSQEDESIMALPCYEMAAGIEG